ncbi:hypothetical protein HMPREF1882_00526 [Streptococcus agalactiae]|nr:hypothetical protein HMPREF1882_00526 [Streptococcus agalactiae]
MYNNIKEQGRTLARINFGFWKRSSSRYSFFVLHRKSMKVKPFFLIKIKLA